MNEFSMSTNEISISTQTHTLGPGRELPIATGGNFFEILSAMGDVEVKLGQGDFNRLPAGLVISDPRAYFRDLVLRNISEEDNTIEIIVGTGDLRDNRFVASGLLNVAAVSGVSFDEVQDGLTDVQAQIAALRDDAWIDLNDYTHEHFSVDTEIVSAADNVAGIEVRYMQLARRDGGGNCSFRSGGFDLMMLRGPGSENLSNLRIPAGQSLRYDDDGAGSNGILIYRVVPGAA